MIAIRWKAWLAALLIFIAGGAVGVLGTVALGLRQVRTELREPAMARHRLDRALGRVESRLVSELKLDAAQAAMVHRELTRSGEELRARRLEAAQRNRRTLATAVLRIGAELPPDKRAELRRLVRQRLSRLGVGLDLAAEESGTAPAQPESTPRP